MSNPPHPDDAQHAPRVRRVGVRYHANASSLFSHLGGTESTDAVLLESADITTKSGLKSVAVLRASLRVTCNGPRVVAQPLSASGEVLARRLRSQLADYLVGDDVYEFPASKAVDERERLTAASSVEVLRALTTRAGYREGDFPFLAGGIAFDYLATFEELPAVGESTNTYPDYQFVLAETLLNIDHRSREAYVAGITFDGTEPALDELAKDIDTADTADTAANEPAKAEPQATLRVTADIPDEQFRADVNKLKADIDNGDIYQVVPARTFTAPCPDAFAAYQRLRGINPSPYMFYVRGLARTGEPFELFGASPESNLKFSAESRQLELYPIAGTRPRGLAPDGSVDHELDTRMELQLRTDAKEIAEHTMLVDLARNDLARVAVPRTRRVAELLQVDRYSRVMHLVSRVTATLDAGLDALDAYRACMNMGTLTGAPKLRATELIRELEGTRRGSYGGAVGYLSGSGDMDTCIVIRSAYVTGGVASVQAGAGVVRDSNPQSEADETLHKAYAVLDAIAGAAGAELEVAK
ncbi:anthranilate synthase component 1 [Corynebacterium liangguodongii]|uniref:Anthranilate synthase component 1 n=1 Tax=Corynebacterium liangguodongii TaxID=2079535 RepID=A0A2S0WGP8_9CORY|nr:anthranilate synthase component 1 [Corynebacterium liangguodongii]AWB84943.1 anthranilate synthase component 1 [Corynebacterium liangguodongii]PWB99349.1 anthranilate synthase component 1 [Corynebacterium liangguodongii]